MFDRVLFPQKARTVSHTIAMLLLHALVLVGCVEARARVCSTDPCVSPAAFDCPMRRLALEYARATVGSGALPSVAAALNLSACGHVEPQPQPQPRAGASTRTYPPRTATRGGVEVFVAVDGSDAGGDGSRAKPFASVARAQTAARRGGYGSVVSITGGTYYLQAPLVLTSADSGTTYQVGRAHWFMIVMLG